MYTLFCVLFTSLSGHLHQTQDLKQAARSVMGQVTGWLPMTPHSMLRLMESKARAMWPGRVCRWTSVVAELGGPLLRPQTEAVSPPPLTLCLK